MSPIVKYAGWLSLAALAAGAASLGCSGSSTTDGAGYPSPTAGASEDGAGSTGEPTLRAAVQPVRRVEDAKPGVYVPPYVDCRAPKAGEVALGPGGQVCTPVAISGCTEPGKYFPDYASCDVVRTQRPYWPAKPAGTPKADDPRLADPSFRKELAWVTEQLRSTGCTCCHDKTQTPEGPSQWDITAEPIWTDTVSDSGIALFTGLADSSVFGSYPSKDNNGFDRTATGVPTTDTARMRAFFRAELARRGISEEQARAVPPFGGPLYRIQKKAPEACKPGEGIDAEGRITWMGASAEARYVYVLEAGSKNPGAPPNGDLPEGTVWRLDVLASADAVTTGALRYGTTPPGSFQAYPEKGRAPALEAGRTYHLFVFRDVGLVATSCLFTYGG